MKPSDSLQDFAYEEIKKRIQNGEYAPEQNKYAGNIRFTGHQPLPCPCCNQPLDCAWSGRGNAEKGHNPLHSFPIPRLEISLKHVR